MKRLILKLKLLIKVILGKEFLAKKDVCLPTEKFGSDYGGWDIVINDINKDSIVYSFGVGEDASFDLALINKFNLTVHAFDPTPKSIEWVGKKNFSNRFVMHEYGIADFDGVVSFNPPENPDHVSHTILDRPSTNENSISVPVYSLRTIMNKIGHSKIDILKMDVEGAEYDVINELCKSDIRPKQLLVEFHHRFPGVGIDKTKNAINLLKSIGYKLFSVSSINEEFSFILNSS